MVGRTAVVRAASTLAIMALLVVALWQAYGWNTRSSLFPLVIGIPLLVMLVIQFVKDILVDVRRERAEGADPVARQRQLQFTAWFIGFAVLIALVGFPLGGPLAMIAYLRFGAGERWAVVLLMGAGTAAFFLALTELLRMQFPTGALLP